MSTTLDPTTNESATPAAAAAETAHAATRQLAGPTVPASVKYDGPTAFVAHPSGNPEHPNVLALIARLTRRGIVASFVGTKLP